jgi:hypothetical protein
MPNRSILSLIAFLSLHQLRVVNCRAIFRNGKHRILVFSPDRYFCREKQSDDSAAYQFSSVQFHQSNSSLTGSLFSERRAAGSIYNVSIAHNAGVSNALPKITFAVFLPTPLSVSQFFHCDGILPLKVSYQLFARLLNIRCLVVIKACSFYICSIAR